ncbi:hypothetical protein HOE22_10890 [Candidatus Woesearchaeota archaeon]|jgi:hypothetical protein|nr:hypothetical protein [Candidatus Woesearchaeota archaeon]MBT4732577.1 hypothetical protein [Candidatus Woesearchaeota archaeon]MBT7558769.1 hypothetical protein [Candidatus Woesearchaeota archaeon]
MATKEIRKLILERFPPGDSWKDPEDPSSGIFPSLTEGLEYAFHKSDGTIKEFHLSSFEGKIYSVEYEEEPDTPPPKPRYSMYGEETDIQPDLWTNK